MHKTIKQFKTAKIVLRSIQVTQNQPTVQHITIVMSYSNLTSRILSVHHLRRASPQGSASFAQVLRPFSTREKKAPQKKRAPRIKKRPVASSGLNLSKTNNSVAEGSFLLTDEGENNGKAPFSAAEALNESKGRNQYSDILIQLQAQNQGANVSLFYKQNGGVVATKGDGALVYQDPQFSRTGCQHCVASSVDHITLSC